MSRKVDSILNPFRVALSGVALTFRTQRHMRFHVYVVVLVMLLAMLANFELRQVLILLFTVSLVLIAEMFNSAIEATVDLIQPNYHPLAKTAKDIAAGAVLITTIVALVVGALLIIGETRWEQIRASLTSEGFGLPFQVRLGIGALMVFFIVVIGKGLGKRGQVLKGGLVSGHAAYAFFLAMGIIAVTDSAPLPSAIGIMLAAIVAQSRWEAKIHSVFELALGAAVGTVVGLVLFMLIPR
jgi:diacylglycerol kinase (ATP)